jgi:hypothetical protein
MRKLVMNILLFCTLMAYLTACRAMVVTETRNEVVADRSALPTEIRDNDSWWYINEQIPLLGMTAYEISEKYRYELMDYYRYGDGSESFLLDTRRCYFSEPVWMETSRCIAVDGYFDLPIDRSMDAELSARYGYDAISNVTGDHSFYQYIFDDNTEIRFYEEPDDLNPASGKIVIKYADCDYTLTESRTGNDINKPEKRKGLHWDKVNQYAETYLGRNFDFLLVAYPDLRPTEDGLYLDPHTEIRFDIRGEVSTAIYLNADQIFPMNASGTLTRNELMRYWNDVSFMWGVYEYSAYVYEFEDIVISIDSQATDGSISKNSIVRISTGY